MVRWDDDPNRLLPSAIGRSAETSMSSTAKTSSTLPGKVFIPRLLRQASFDRLFCRFRQASSEPRGRSEKGSLNHTLAAPLTSLPLFVPNEAKGEVQEG